MNGISRRSALAGGAAVVAAPFSTETKINTIACVSAETGRIVLRVPAHEITDKLMRAEVDWNNARLKAERLGSLHRKAVNDAAIKFHDLTNLRAAARFGIDVA